MATKKTRKKAEIKKIIKKNKKSFIGFCVGNGLSRKHFDLGDLRRHGIIYGCNAMYRDFIPDVLVALDYSMLLEIRQSDYKGTLAYFNNTRKKALIEEVGVENSAKILFDVPQSNWYTGIAALWFMCKRHPELTRICLLGFDFYESKTNNLYAGSPNYVKMGMNNAIQFEAFRDTIFKEFKDKSFYRVGNTKDPFPDEWKGFSNIEFMSYKEFEGLLG